MIINTQLAILSEGQKYQSITERIKEQMIYVCIEGLLLNDYMNIHYAFLFKDYKYKTSTIESKFK